LHNGFRFPVQALPIARGESIGGQNAAEPFYRNNNPTGNRKPDIDMSLNLLQVHVQGTAKKLLFHLCGVIETSLFYL
jgi:hypothetical protein